MLDSMFLDLVNMFKRKNVNMLKSSSYFWIDRDLLNSNGVTCNIPIRVLYDDN